MANEKEPTLIDLAVEAINDPSKRYEAAGLLRAIARPIFNSLLTNRVETISEAIRPLEYLARKTNRVAEQETPENGEAPADLRYIMGIIEGILNMANVAADQAPYETVIQKVQHPPFREILERLQDKDEIRLTELAKGLPVSEKALPVILWWMNEHKLVYILDHKGNDPLVSLWWDGQKTIDALPPKQVPQPEVDEENLLMELRSYRRFKVSVLMPDENNPDKFNPMPIEEVPEAGSVYNIKPPKSD